jgi:peptide-methionine (R)-S-oxide reductase
MWQRVAAVSSSLLLCAGLLIQANAWSPSSSVEVIGRRRTTKNTSLQTSTDSEETTETKTGTWNPLSLAILKLGFTEPAWTSPYNYKNDEGSYVCANCKTPLFPSSSKYDSGSGWPSFWKTIDSNKVALEKSWDGRIEATCNNCGGHLGHVFPDGPTRGKLDANELATVPDSDPDIGYKAAQGNDAGGEKSQFSRMPRYCINGAALKFEEK